MADRVNADCHPTDIWGVQQPHRLTVLPFARAIPGLIDQFAAIPSEYWAKVEDDGVEVSCPCGETPALSAGGLVQCECERFYTFTGQQVMVANRAGQYAPTETETERVP